MGFLDDVKAEALATRKPQNVCTVGVWLSTVDEETADEFRAALANTDAYPATVIFKVMKKRGVEGVPVYAIRRHRRLECECADRGKS